MKLIDEVLIQSTDFRGRHWRSRIAVAAKGEPLGELISREWHQPVFVQKTDVAQITVTALNGKGIVLRFCLNTAGDKSMVV